MVRRALVAAAAAALAVASVLPAGASHNQDLHSENMSLAGRFDAGGKYRTGTDIAFWGDLAVLGNYDNPGGFRLVDISNPRAPRQVGQLECPGPQNDVSIWEDLVVVSVDSPRAGEECGRGGALQTDQTLGTAWEGIRLVSIADPAHPRQIVAVKTDCGSHTHTLVPDLARNRLFVYVLSYPLSAQGANCNFYSHGKISVVEVPLAHPADARVVSTPSVSPAPGCHDVTVFLSKMIAGAACITESQIWDIRDPANPQIMAHITNPEINIHHSSSFSWDAKTLVLGDELGGAEASPGCLTEGRTFLGALWFYDVSDPASPVQKSYFQSPHRVDTVYCTAHDFNVIPMRGRNVLVSAWYNGGTEVIDFTDPAAPREIGYYLAKEPAVADTWSSYWYNGLIYVNNFDEDVGSSTARSRGLDVLRLAEPSIASAAISLPHLNPQVQEPLPGGAPVTAPRQTKVLGTGTARTLPRSGTETLWLAGGLALAGAAEWLRRWIRAVWI